MTTVDLTRSLKDRKDKPRVHSGLEEGGRRKEAGGKTTALEEDAEIPDYGDNESAEQQRRAELL